MAISRITKSIVTVLGAESYNEAAEVRNKDIDFILPPADVDLDVMVQSAVALSLRCFTGRLRFHGPMSDRLGKVIMGEALKMNALPRLDFQSSNIGEWMLAFGCKRDGAICGDASGWTARINGTFEERLPSTCSATFCAACIVAKLFSFAVLRRGAHAYEAWDFCLSSFTSEANGIVRPHDDLDLGRVGLLGAGAIGSATGFVLLRCRARADVVVIDPQEFEEPNLETCILADVAAVNRLLKKAGSLAESLRSGGIKANAETERIEEQHVLLKQQWAAFVCGVDNSETRRMLDDTNAPVLLNAGLGDSSDDAGFILWTRHAGSGWRLSDMYARRKEPSARIGVKGHLPKEFRDGCSRMPYESVSLSIPFVALAAGSLLAAGLYHEARGESPVSNYLQFDLLGKQQKYARRLRG